MNWGKQILFVPITYSLFYSNCIPVIYTPPLTIKSNAFSYFASLVLITLKKITVKMRSKHIKTNHIFNFSLITSNDKCREFLDNSKELLKSNGNVTFPITSNKHGSIPYISSKCSINSSGYLD